MALHNVPNYSLWELREAMSGRLATCARHEARVPDATFTVTEIQGDGNSLVETGELFQITINPPATSTLVPGETFTIEVVPPQGGTLLIERTMPPELDTVMNLH